MVGRKKIVDWKIQKGNFQRDKLAPISFAIAKMSENYIHRKFNWGYLLSCKKINPLIYIDGMKLFAKNEKELDADINNKNIHSEYKMGVATGKKCAILIMKNGKRQPKE